MFTGLVECMGEVIAVQQQGGNLTFIISQEKIAPELEIDESVAHNGICLTVEAIQADRYQVTAIDETIRKTNISAWKPGDIINLERAMKLSDRLGGHIVQGHIDTTGICASIEDQEGSTLFTFTFPEAFAGLVIEKGSIAVNGTSLTCFRVGSNEFSVSIIPYTMEHTGFNRLKAGDIVNLEFDLIGKYLQRNIHLVGDNLSP